MRLSEFTNIDETLKKVKGRWALVSKSNPKKVLQYYRGPKDERPSDEWVRKVERRVHAFEDVLHEEPVASSWIVDLTYLEFEDGTHGVQMTTKGGRSYFIDGVSQDDYNRWMSAMSKGKHYWSDIKYFY